MTAWRRMLALLSRSLTQREVHNDVGDYFDRLAIESGRAIFPLQNHLFSRLDQQRMSVDQLQVFNVSPLLMSAVNSTVPWTRVDLASGGYTGMTLRSRLASATRPPNRTGWRAGLLFGCNSAGAGAGAAGTRSRRLTIPGAPEPLASPTVPAMPISGAGIAGSTEGICFGTAKGATTFVDQVYALPVWVESGAQKVWESLRAESREQPGDS
jgi:hypothetical protein